jgi:hypothetical protein
LARPFDSSELPGLGDGLSVFDETAIVEFLVAFDRFGNEGLLLLRGQLAAGNEVEIALGMPQDLFIG